MTPPTSFEKPPHGATPRSTLAGRYELIRELGRGGMATVYLADDRKHSRHVAAKILRPGYSAAIGADRFEREIKLVARLQHPHILPLYDSGEVGDELFFVMPYVEGESLRDRLEREKSLSLAEAAVIIRHVGDALDYAHARGVVHRDIKPGNILISTGQALLADFGIARGASDDSATLTAAGTTLGTPVYMSPEQASGERDIDGRSDLYSLGCVCYEMLSGGPPFHGESTMALFSQHIVKTPPRVSSLRETLAEEVVSAVARMLSKDPAERYQSAGQFATVLEDAAMRARAPSQSDERLKALQRDREKSKAVFVLDFTNISGAVDIEWLSTGIAETVSVDLKKVSGIRVIGSDPATRQRVAAIRRERQLDAETARELGQSLGARWVVWGAFQKAGTRIRLTPHFGDTETGEIVSAEKIDGGMEDIFALQDRIVMGLADVLRIKLTSEEVDEIARSETSQLTAYELYAKGQQAFNIFGKESAKMAAEFFRKAVELDPNYARAWAGLGSLLMPKYIASGLASDLDEGVTALQRAMQLDPSMGEPYVYLSYMYGRQHRHNDAIASARMAVEREPSATMAWYLLGITLGMRGVEDGVLPDMGRAIPPLLRAASIDADFHPTFMVAGALYLLRGQYAHAIQVVEKAVAVEKRNTRLIFLGSFVQRAALHTYSNELDSAIPLLDLALSTYPRMDHVYAVTMTAYAHFIRGVLEEHRGDDATAAAHFRKSCDAAESNDHRLAVGAHWVKSKLGLARIAWRSGDKAGSDLALIEALTMHHKRPRFVWGWIMGAADAETYFEVAAAHAVRDETAECIAALRKAADLGWADMNQLNHDPAFVTLRERAEIRQLGLEAGSRVILPAPVGNGGLPDLA
ncbi:MAG: protein kinase domain-containing protein [Gemmatimonadaceae bacterium]